MTAHLARATIAGLVLGLALLPSRATAQSQQGAPVVVEPEAMSSPSLEPEADAGEGTAPAISRSVTPMLAPIPFRNSQLGWGLMLMGGLFHRFDSDPTVKPSAAMLGGFYTENGSWGVMAVENAKLGGDRWRLRALLNHSEVRYDFYGIGEGAGEAGQSIGLEQKMDIVTAAALRRITRGVYLGVTGLWMDASTALRDTSGLGAYPGLSVTDTAQIGLFAWGLQGEVDTRNDDYWPSEGTLARLRAFFFTDALGGSHTFQRYLLSGSWYMPIRSERLVLATNLTLCGVNGDVPFWNLCSIGFGRGGLRGYTQGRYRDSVMTTGQVELRYHSSGRFGAAAFGGFGQVAPSPGDIFNAEMLLAGGLGARYQLTSKFPMHLRLDYSWGRDGGLLYFGVGEAF